MRGRLIISHVTSGTNAHMRGHVSEDAFGWPVLLSSALAGNKTLPVFVRVGLCVWFFFAFAYFSLRDSAVAMQSRSRREEEGDEEKGGNQSLFFLSLSLSLSDDRTHPLCSSSGKVLHALFKYSPLSGAHVRAHTRTKATVGDLRCMGFYMLTHCDGDSVQRAAVLFPFTALVCLRINHSASRVCVRKGLKDHVRVLSLSFVVHVCQVNGLPIISVFKNL